MPRLTPPLLLLALVYAPDALAKTVVVDGVGSGTDRYKTVQAGLNAATGNGDIVEIVPGTWSACDLAPNNQNITIRRKTGETDAVVLQCTTSGKSVFKTTNAKNYTLTNLVLEGVGATAIVASSADLFVTDVQIDVTSTGGALSGKTIDATRLDAAVPGAGLIATTTLKLADSVVDSGSLALQGATLTITNSAISGTTAILASASASATGSDLVATGACVSASAGVTTTLASTTCTTTGTVGLDLADDLTATDVTVTGARTTAIRLTGGGVSTLTRVGVDPTATTGLVVDASTVDLVDSDISGVSVGIELLALATVDVTGGSVDGATASVRALTGGSKAFSADGAAFVEGLELVGGDTAIVGSTVDATGDGLVLDGTTNTLVDGADVYADGTALWLDVTGTATLTYSVLASASEHGLSATAGTLVIDTVLLHGALGNEIYAPNLDFDYVSAVATTGTGLLVGGTLSGANLYAVLFSGTTPFSNASTGSTPTLQYCAANSSAGTDILPFSATNEVGGLALDGGARPSAASIAVDIAPKNGGRFDLDGVKRDQGAGSDAGAYEFVDTDGDGLSDGAELAWGLDPTKTDTDGDGIADGSEWGTGSTPRDTDKDGVPDGADLDDDGDGISTVAEGATDSDGDGIPDYRDDDDDDDMLLSRDEDVDRNGDPRNDDTDKDGTPDYLDTDDDGDGILTAWEVEYGADPLSRDSDDDGALDDAEWGSGTIPRDTDGDGYPDIIDSDDDGDGISTLEEGLGDRDGDGVPNYRDTDSDGDGKPDTTEGTGDDDFDSIPNFLDSNDADGVTGDEDGDGLPNVKESAIGTDPFDADSDADGLGDGVEVGADVANPVDTDGDGVIDALDDDDDDDTVLTAIEAPDGTARDTDGDGVFDHLDDDDDDDDLPTAREDRDRDGTAANDDRDCDGVADYLEAGEAEVDGPCGDADGDLLGKDDEVLVGSDPDRMDSDGDGVPDGYEIGDVAAPRDTDNDGILDVHDDDDDGDGIPTADEGAWDVDGDGFPNHLDPDADGDGSLDAQEGTGDADCDGTPEFLDPRDDGLCPDTGIETSDDVADDASGGCSTVPAAPAAGVWLLALLGLRRRR